MIHNKRRHNRRRVPEEPYRVNEKIRAREVRLVGEGIEPGLYTIEKALRIAKDMDLDLVEISKKGTHPICKVVEYSKFKYEQKKKEKKLKAKAHKVVLKEIRLTVRIGEHDFEFKKKHAFKFLRDGATIKIYIQLRGREFYIGRDVAKENIARLVALLKAEGAQIKQEVKLTGRRMSAIVEPTKKKT